MNMQSREKGLSHCCSLSVCPTTESFCQSPRHLTLENFCKGMLRSHFVSALPLRNKNPLGTSAVEGDNSREEERAFSLLLLLLPGMPWAGTACSPPVSWFIWHSSITHSPSRGQGGTGPCRARAELWDPPGGLCWGGRGQTFLSPPGLGWFLWYPQLSPSAFLGACDGALMTGTRTVKWFQSGRQKQDLHPGLV